MEVRRRVRHARRHLAPAAWRWCMLLSFAVGVQPSMVLQTQWEPGSESPQDICASADLELPTLEARVHRSHSRTASLSHRLEGDSSKHRKLVEEQVQAHELFKTIFAHDILLSPSMLEQGLSNLGNTQNLHRALLKLLTGQPIRMVIIGGSVSLGHGNKDLQNSYFQRIASWVNTTFPHPEHVFTNNAIPAATSSYVSPCVLNLVPNDTDIVLLEFTFNDSERSEQKFDDPTRRGLERLLRKLVDLPSQPALIYLHYWAALKMQSYTDTVEDSIDIVLKYYGVLGLSMRTALHLLVDEQPDLKEQIWWPPQAGDAVHPTCIGSRYMRQSLDRPANALFHRYPVEPGGNTLKNSKKLAIWLPHTSYSWHGAQYLADLVIGHLQDQAATVLVAYLHSMHAGTVDTLWQGLEAHAQELPAPVLPGNWGNLTETCILDESFKDLVTPKWGFKWTDEGRGKWGFVAHKEWSRLEIVIPTTNLAVEKRQLLLGLGFLMSYQHMGMALVECLEGCTCKKREYAFTLPSWAHTSEPVWKTVPLYLWEKFYNCSLAVTVLDKTKSRENPPEHKVKLLALMMTGEMGFVNTWTFCDDCLNETGANLN